MRGRNIAAVTAVLGASFVAGALHGGETVASPEPTEVAAPTTTGLKANLSAAVSLEQLTVPTEVVDIVTDAILQRDDISMYNCGGKLRPIDQAANEFNGDYWIKYANDNPQLGPKLMGFLDNALNASAVDSLLTNGKTFQESLLAQGIETRRTSPDKKIVADDRADQLAHVIGVAQTGQDRTYANFSCKKGNEVDIHRATAKPTISITKGGHVEGVELDQAGVEDFLSKVKKFKDGTAPVDILTLPPRGDNKDYTYLVVLKAYGCDNPILRLTPPDVPVTTLDKGTPTTATTTTIPDKVPRPRTHDAHTALGDGGQAENGDDPRDDSDETGYGRGDTATQTVPSVPHPQNTLPPNLPPASTGPERTPAPSVPVATIAPTATVTAPPLGD